MESSESQSSLMAALAAAALFVFSLEEKTI